jgi:hypothetical protein
MDAKRERAERIGDIAKVSFSIGEYTFLGIAIGAFVTDNPFINRWLLAGAGMFLSLLFYFFHLYFNAKQRKLTT